MFSFIKMLVISTGNILYIESEVNFKKNAGINQNQWQYHLPKFMSSTFFYYSLNSITGILLIPVIEYRSGNNEFW